VVVAVDVDVAPAGVDAVLLVELRFAVAPWRPDAPGDEQPSAESATPTSTVSAQIENHFLMSDRSKLDRQQRIPVITTETQLASWTTSASPTLA
jgi:hypothetical protein